MQIKSVCVHQPGPNRHKVFDELLLVVTFRIHLSIGTQDGVRAKDQIYARSRPLGLTCFAITDVVGVAAGRLSLICHVGEAYKKIVGQHTCTVGEHTMHGAAVVGTQDAHTANQCCHLVCSEAHELCTVKPELFVADHLDVFDPVVKAIMDGFEYRKFLDFFAVVEALHDGVVLGILLMQDIVVEGFGPLRHVAPTCGGVAAVRHWALNWV